MNINNWLNNKPPQGIDELEPDVSKTSKVVSKQHQMIAWDHWFKGRTTHKWATLINYNIITKNCQRHYNLEKWAVDLITTTWQFIHDMWCQSNKTEHDPDGDPKQQQTEKLITIMHGES
jgi:hypothetical protein